MPKKDDIYHSILIVSASEQFNTIVKRSLTGFITVDTVKSATTARRRILERYYDIVVINAPLPDESGDILASDTTMNCNASVLLVTLQNEYEDTLERVTDYGVLVVPKPSPRGRIDKAIRFLAAIQTKMQSLEKKRLAAEEKIEEMRIINKAKFMLVGKMNMTEDEAHRYIGKQAMDSGISRGRAAMRIMDELD